MNGVMRKLAALILAVAMITTFTPLYGAGAIAYAEDETVAAEQDNTAAENADPEGTAAGDENLAPAEGAEVTGTESPEADLSTKENGGEEVVQEEENGEPETPEDGEEQPPLMKAPLAGSDAKGDGDEGDDDDPFPGVVKADLERLEPGDPKQDWFFTDGTATFQLTDENALNVDDVIKYEPYVSGGPDFDWAPIDDSCYSYDDATKTIVLNGSAIAAKPEYDEIRKIVVQIKGLDAEENGNIKMLATSEIKFWSTYIEYRLPEDRDVLPGWDGQINGSYDGYVENTEHPRGDDFRFEVTDVKITEGRDLLSMWDPGNHRWYYRAGNEPGKVTFRITYTDYDGNPQTEDRHLFIGHDVYGSNIWSEGNVFTGLPGSSIHLNASAFHDFMTEGDDSHHDSTVEGLDFIWEVVHGEEYGEVTRNPDNHSEAILTFKEVESGDYEDVGCRVKLTVVDTNSDDPEAERSVQVRWFSVRTDYLMIWPSELRTDLNIGQTIADQTFELRHYKYGGTEEEGYNNESYKLETINKVKWDFDSEAFRITKAGGGNVAAGETYEGCDTFSFTRKTEHDTGMHLTVNEGEGTEAGVDYWFFNRNYGLWFYEDDINVYSDTAEDPQLRINTGDFGRGAEADDDFIFTVTAGEWDNEEWIHRIPSADYTVERDGDDLIVKFDRDALFPEGGNWDRDIRVNVEARSRTTDFSREREAWMHLREARYEFDQPEYMELLPDESRRFDQMSVWIENTEYPWGERFDFEVLNVEVTSGEEYLEFVPTADNGWEFKAKDCGTVNFVITYKDEHGDVQEYNVEVNITGDIYEAWVHSDEPYNCGLPGTDLEIHAEAVHRYVNKDGWHQEDWEGFDYEWSIINGGEFATIVPNAKDPSRATLKLKDMPAGRDWLDERIDVKVVVKDPQSDDPQEERASGEEDFYVRSEYVEIWPADIGNPMDLGVTTDDIQFEVRRYSVFGDSADGYTEEGFKPYAIESAKWNYGEDVLTITTADGEAARDNQEVECDTFRFTRNRNWDHDFELRARYRDDDGNEQEAFRHFHLEDLHYNLWFNDGGIKVYDDGQWTVSLEKDDWLDYSNLDIRFSAGHWEGEDIWIDAPDDVWALSEDKQSVTVFGDKMYEQGIDGFEIRAEAFYINGDDTWSVGEPANCWVELCESCISHGEEHLWLKAPPEYKDCVSEGTQKMMCWNCQEKKVVTVPPRGHVAKKIAAKAATASAEGNIQYWKCSFCGKCFTDSKCTKAISLDGTKIPKGMVLSKVTPLKKGFTATWKAPTGKDLTHTSGYELMYALNSKYTSGKKTVTITSPKTASKKVTSLKGGTKYYVKIRKYRTIAGKKYYSPWSATKTVTTKK